MNKKKYTLIPKVQVHDAGYDVDYRKYLIKASA